MDGLRGYVEQIRFASSAWVNGGGANGDSTVTGGTDHICTFQIDSKTVRVVSADPPVIETGDEVVVAGKRRNDGIFYGSYYSNLSRGIHHSRGSAERIVLIGIAVIVIALSLAATVPSIRLSISLVAIPVLLLCILEAYTRHTVSSVLKRLSESI